MGKGIPKASRRPRTRGDIQRILCTRIHDNTYPSGSRLPTHRALFREFGVSPATLQHAFNRLIEFGLVVSRGRLGTFVRKGPPELSCVALVFPDEPNMGSWNRFLATMLRSIEVAQGATDGANIRLYFIAGGSADADGAHRLLADARAGVLSGLGFIYTPWYLDPVLFDLTLPRVVVGGMSAADVKRYQASILESTYNKTQEQLLRGFVATGRRRFASLTAMNQDAESLRSLAHAMGLETRPQWCLELPVDTVSAVSARTVIHLLCSKPAPDRPDCLLIGDDNLVPYATAGILDAGMSAADVSIAAHANFPDVTRSLVSCQRYGLDAEVITNMLLSEISRLAKGGVPRTLEIPAKLRAVNAG